MPSLPLSPADRPPAVLTRSLAREAGVPVRRLSSQEYVRLYHNTYVPSGPRLTTLLRARTALGVLSDDCAISHHTAVALWGGVAPDTSTVHVTTSTRGARCRRRGITAHVTEERSVTSHRGLRISTPVQAFLELAAAGVDLVDLVIAGDSLVKAAGLEPEAFLAAAKGWSGRGARLARQAAGLVRSGVDSPMETKLRLLIVFAGLPEPRTDRREHGPDGQVTWRSELAYEEGKVLLEYDGRQHAEDDGQWGHDITRREELDRLGWRLVIVRARDIYRHPDKTLLRIHRILLERGVPDVPKVLRPDWSRYFPVPR